MSDSIKLHTMDLFSRFFQENQEKFLTFAYSYLRDKAEAEDVLMESMIALWENRNRWKEGSNLHALLLTIIKNKSLNLLEHKKIRLQAEENINSHNQRELNLRIFDNERQHIVHKALEQMPQQSRTIFMLSRYQNLPNKQIAEQLHVSLKTVEAHITKALRILRLELKDYLASILL